MLLMTPPPPFPDDSVGAATTLKVPAIGKLGPALVAIMSHAECGKRGHGEGGGGDHSKGVQGGKGGQLGDNVELMQGGVCLSTHHAHVTNHLPIRHQSVSGKYIQCLQQSKDGALI